MNAYFTASTRDLSNNRATYKRIIEILEDKSVNVENSWLVESINDSKTDSSPQEILLRNLHLLTESDFAVVELTKPSLGVGYFIGQAIANHKKILCLYPEKTKDEDISEVVSGSTSSLLTYKKYNLDNLATIIKDFIASLKMGELRKFNFIANEKIIDYIEKGSQSESKSKSEFLRDKILRELMN